MFGSCHEDHFQSESFQRELKLHIQTRLNRLSSDGSNDILAPYLICCGYIMAIVVFMFILYLKNVIKRITQSHEDTLDTRNCIKIRHTYAQLAHAEFYKSTQRRRQFVNVDIVLCAVITLLFCNCWRRINVLYKYLFICNMYC